MAGRRVARNAREAIQTFLKFSFQQVGRNAGLFHQARYQTFFLFQQSKGQMFDIHCLMLKTCANGLRLVSAAWDFSVNLLKSINVQRLNNLQSWIDRFRFSFFIGKRRRPFFRFCHSNSGRLSRGHFETAVTSLFIRQQDNLAYLAVLRTFLAYDAPLFSALSVGSCLRDRKGQLIA